MVLLQYFWRFTQICKKFAASAWKIVFVIFSEQFYYRNNNKNNFASKCCKFLANLRKSLEILEQCHVKWWLDYRIYAGSVPYSFSCTFVDIVESNFVYQTEISFLFSFKWIPEPFKRKWSWEYQSYVIKSAP